MGSKGRIGLMIAGGLAGLLLAAWLAGPWVRVAAQLRAVVPAPRGEDYTLMRLPGGGVRRDYPDGMSLATPPGYGDSFSLSWPEMTPVIWMNAPVSAPPFRDEITPAHFPVHFMGMTYLPQRQGELQTGRMPRPRQIALNYSRTLVRVPSPWPGLMALAPPGTTRATGSYVEADGIPYELFLDCNSQCRGHVLSLRTHLRYELWMSPEGVAHFLDLVQDLDRLALSWTPPDSRMARLYRESAGQVPPPWPDFTPPPACAAPAYAELPAIAPVEGPSTLVMAADDTLYVLRTRFARSGVLGEDILRLSAREARAGRAPATIASGLVNVRGMALEDPRHLLLSFGDGSIRRLATDGLLAGLVVPVSGAVGDPNAMVMAPDGALYSIRFQVGELVRTRGLGSRQEQTVVVAAGMDRAESLARDRQGNLYVADGGRGVILRITPGGRLDRLVEGLRKPHEVAVDAQGSLFVADDSLGELTKLLPSGERCTISRGSHDYLGLAVDTHGVLYAADLRGNAIHRFAPVVP